MKLDGARCERLAERKLFRPVELEQCLSDPKLGNYKAIDKMHNKY